VSKTAPLAEVRFREAPRRQTFERVGFIAILVAFAALSLIYNIVTPAGEGVDEISHLQYTLYIKDHRALPILPFTPTSDTVLMGYHPPLYYLIAAVLISPLPTDDLARSLPENPHFVWIEGIGTGNRNVFLHSPVNGGDPFPYRGVVLAIHVLRLVSTLEGIAALIVARALLRLLLGYRPALVLAASAAIAFQPTVLNTFSVAQNDGAVALAILLGILWCARIVDQAIREQVVPSPVAGGIILGLALLTKETTFALFPAYALAIGLVALRTRQWLRLLATALGIGVITLALAGWWYARNFWLYGNPLAQNLFAALYPAYLHHGPYRWEDFVAFIQQLGRNYWAGFGYEHILADQRLSNGLWLLSTLAAIAFIVTLIRDHRDRRALAVWAIALTALGATFLLFVKWSTIVGGGAAHGRFFVGVMPVVDAVIVTGLARLSPKRWPVGPIAFAGGMAAFGVLAPFQVIAPAYRPPVATTAEVAAAQPETAIFGGQLRLVASQMTPSLVRPNATTSLVLFWRRARPMTADLRFRVQAVARDGTVFFDKVSWPAGGGVPTYTWPEGVTYRDTVRIPVPGNVAPGVSSIRVSVQTSNGVWLGSNNAREVNVGSLRIANLPEVRAVPSDAERSSAVFGGQLELTGYHLPKTVAPRGNLATTLYWRADRPIEQDVTVSVQLLDPTGHLVAQDDAEPAQGQAPTSTWPRGVVIVDTHTVALPASLPRGVYQVIVVAYTRPSMARLSVADAASRGDYLTLGDVKIP